MAFERLQSQKIERIFNSTRRAVREMLRFGPISAEEAFIRLSKLAVHSNVNDGIDASGEVYQDVANDMGVLERKG